MITGESPTSAVIFTFTMSQIKLPHLLYYLGLKNTVIHNCTCEPK